VTVGGHVEIGDSYEETAVKEILEETGLKVDISQLIPIQKRRSHTFDDITKMQNNA
jgi:ADP-ribose pyrophosphatase YjhB (NUDIX family)